MPNWPRIGPWLSAAVLLLTTQGASQPVSSPNLDLSGLGQVTVAGNFDAVSLYEYTGQRQGLQTSSSDSVLAQLPNGLQEILASSDASIQAMCPFVLKNGTYVGLIVGGNFTSLGGVEARSIALIDTQSLQVYPHVGIQGSVTSMYCDQNTETVYIGGMFEASTSHNAITWTANGAWANLPFQGFDGPVYSVDKAPSGNIVFGGAFTGLGNTTALSTNSTREQLQLIDLSRATITSTNNVTSAAGIVCPGSSTWQLQDNSPGAWTANFRYGFEPNIIRLWNQNSGGRGVQTWRLTALPINGIMNLSYVDPGTQERRYCDAFCPLADSADYQEFEFVNSVGMNSFRIDVSAWYGTGAGLRGIEIYQKDVFVYAIEANTPAPCGGSQTLSSASTTGSWYETPSRNSNADYLTVVTGPTTVQSTEIVFEPDIQQTGNYTVLVYTPGCLQDSSCSARAIVNVTATLTSNGGTTFSQQIYQTNNNDKYDPVYMGRIEAKTGSFQPRVTLRASGSQTDQLLVADRVRFTLTNTTGGLNGLFEFDPNAATIDSDFSDSAINSAGNVLQRNALIRTLAVHDGTIYAGGRFTHDDYTNILSFADNKAQSLSNGGLNGPVLALYSSNDLLYAGGNFTTTRQGDVTDLGSAAAYSYADNTWVALAAGLDGTVTNVSPLTLNISGPANETCIAFSGSFQNIRQSGSNKETPVRGFAVWVPSRKAWLETLDVQQQIYSGQLTSYSILPNNTWIGAGTLQSLGDSVSGAVALKSASSGNVQLQQLPLNIMSSSSNSPLVKRDIIGSENVTGVVTATWDTNNDRNLTILGGQFFATGNDSATVRNVLIYDGKTNTISGLPVGADNNSTFLSLAVSNDLLIAGGKVTGSIASSEIAGLLMYNLNNNTFRSPQPAALSGTDVVVYSIQPQPSSSNIYVGGSFDGTTSGLACRSVCAYDTSSNAWSTVGGQLQGTVAALYWVSNNELLAAGNLSISGNRTSLARFDVKQQAWSVQNSTGIPGPVTAFGPGTLNGDHVWVAGTATNGSTYLVEVDGDNFRPVVGAFGEGTTIRGLKIMQLSQQHDDSQYLERDQALLVSGQLNLTGFGPASAALFNGTSMRPFLLASNTNGDTGIINGVFSEKSDNLRNGGPRHSRGITVLVALCAALGTIFLIILIGIIVNRIQRKRSGYNTVPTVPYADKNTNIARVPPESLFGTLGQRSGGAPTV